MITWGPIVMTGILIGYGSYTFASLPRDLKEPSDIEVTAPSVPAVIHHGETPWGVFRATTRLSGDGGGSMGDRYRYAGSFSSLSWNNQGEMMTTRKAILDDLVQKKQFMALVDQVFDGIRVISIERKQIVLEENARQEILRLGFMQVLPMAGTSDQKNKNDDTRFEDMPALDRSRFGKRIGETRWVLKRDAIMEYYQELIEDPQRIASMYLSLKPIWDETNNVEGYYLGQEGENDFFSAMGFQEGDVVRKVNSMRMVSQRRAEYLLKEFSDSTLNTFVFDIERKGKKQKMIYLVR